jgi:glycosyltransferase involved in cell wall biosynthesis
MALIFLGVEDFGIVPVEAMASGTPVLGIRAGGLLETVKPGFTGELVEDLQPRSMQSGIKRILKNSYPECVNQALRFSRKNFARSFESWIWNSR